MQDPQFEQHVLAQVALYASMASFTSGTLFVECAEDAARKIFHILIQQQGLGHVQVSKAGVEYAFDFI